MTPPLYCDQHVHGILHWTRSFLFRPLALFIIASKTTGGGRGLCCTWAVPFCFYVTMCYCTAFSWWILCLKWPPIAFLVSATHPCQCWPSAFITRHDVFSFLFWPLDSYAMCGLFGFFPKRVPWSPVCRSAACWRWRGRCFTWGWELRRPGTCGSASTPASSISSSPPRLSASLGRQNDKETWEYMPMLSCDDLPCELWFLLFVSTKIKHDRVPVAAKTAGG